MAGQFFWNFDGSVTTQLGPGYTGAEAGFFDVPVALRSLSVTAYNTGSCTIKPVVYNRATHTLVAAGPQVTLAFTAGQVYEIFFSAPVNLASGTQYYIGYFVTSGSTAWPGWTSSSVTRTIGSSPAFSTWTDLNANAWFNPGETEPITQSGGAQLVM